ncbi:uncharacterized protein [Epargyreus clarus]|uniref:uncharacterized protein n=1 Tax=Epargyreus clarus TaxID=520877 RepID=UPI003C2AE8CC
MKMGEQYFNLKRKLEELGYNNTLPVDAVPLVECLLADLLQTTRSLQHYMNLSKEALMQRDALMLEAEPYKCDNAKLIQENNKLHMDILQLREESLRVNRDNKRKIKVMSDELARKDVTISKLQHEVRDLSLRGLCADTQSSRNRSRRKDGGDNHISKTCICSERNGHIENDVAELNKKVQLLQEKNEEYCDEIAQLSTKVENRDSEIIRLNIMLEGGRPMHALKKDFSNEKSDPKVQTLLKQLSEMEKLNNDLKREHEKSLEKQHEAMMRALNLADKNKNLQEELQKVDALALKVEEDCNKKLATLMNEMNFMQTRLESLTIKNSELEREITHQLPRENSSRLLKIQESFNVTVKERDLLQKEIKDLVELNKTLQDKIVSLSQVNRSFESQVASQCKHFENPRCIVKDELQKLLEDERRKYEQYMASVQEKLTDTISVFNNHIKNKDRTYSSKLNVSSENSFIRDLHKKLCESEQKILMLKRENDEIRCRVTNKDECNKQGYQDLINHLNAENAELSKENIALSQQLSHYKAINSANYEKTSSAKDNVNKLKENIEMLSNEIKFLKKDKQEYCNRYKEAMELVDKLKRDLAFKQREVEHLEEENCSYKMTNRTGKASVDQLKDECNFLREQLKRIQTDVVKEKTLANQIKNIQLETERNNNECTNELLSVQKKLSLSKDTIDTLERRCKDLQSELLVVKNEKSSLIDNIRVLDQERDKLVMELDNKTETLSSLETKIKSQTYDISKLESEIADLKRKLNMTKVTEHKIADYETQLTFLNGEILRLTQQLDTAVMENKHLQNSLTDANGALKLNKIELDKSKKNVESLKQQLQHYVAEIRRIEELLSQKEAERSDMLEQFASLSVEANILENTNHSLESESASKSIQLQTYVGQVQDLESKLIEKENMIDSQSSRIASMACKINALENEVKLITEEKQVLEQNISYLKQMCNTMQRESSSKMAGVNEMDSELKLYENRIKNLSSTKAKLEVERDEMLEKVKTTERLLSNARREIVDLKLALQDATAETKSLQGQVDRLSRRDIDSYKVHEISLSREELELPLMLEETIHEVSQEDDDSIRYEELHTKHSKFSHGSTL